MPGRRSTILYWPFSSVVAERTLSISASLAASTTTPGMTAPLVSLTTPAMLPVCASASAGARKTALSARHVRIRRFVLTIGPPAVKCCKPPTVSSCWLQLPTVLRRLPYRVYGGCQERSRSVGSFSVQLKTEQRGRETLRASLDTRSWRCGRWDSAGRIRARPRSAQVEGRA